MLIEEDGQSQFSIDCPQDSSQSSTVEYRSFSYSTILKNIDDKHPLSAIKIKLSVLINEQLSTLDKLQLADVLIFSVQKKDSEFIEIFRYVVLERGYTHAIQSGFIFYDGISLGQKIYYNVFRNTEHPEQIIIYYSNQGLIALEYDSVFYTL